MSRCSGSADLCTGSRDRVAGNSSAGYTLAVCLIHDAVFYGLRVRFAASPENYCLAATRAGLCVLQPARNKHAMPPALPGLHRTIGRQLYCGLGAAPFYGPPGIPTPSVL